MAHGPWRANNAEAVEKSCFSGSSRNFITSLLQPVTGHSNPSYTTSLYFFKNDINTTLPSMRRSLCFFLLLCFHTIPVHASHLSSVCYIPLVIIIIIIIIIIPQMLHWLKRAKFTLLPAMKEQKGDTDRALLFF